MARDPVRRREGEVGASRGAAEGAGAVGKRTRVEAVYPTLARALRGEADPAAGDEAPTIHDAATAAVEHKGGGAPVDGGVAATVGAHVGADFGGVRVHQDALATEASAAMGARAFAHGADVFLGAGESGSDLGLMAHELTHVAQQGAAGRRAVQRKVEVGDANSPAEHEADAVAAAVTGGASPAALLVDDGPVAPGQMLKSTFLAELRAEVTAAADAELGPMFSAIGCPYIDQYFRRYTGRSAADGEALLRRYAPGVRSARDARAMIPIVVERVRAGVAVWRDTGQPPPEVAALEPAAAAAATAAGAPAAGAQALRAPDGSETLASLEHDLGPGAALDGATASRMTGALGADLGAVRIHTGPVAAAKAAAVDAVAFAVGPNIVMGARAPAAGTVEGDALLAHELAHTVQQADAARDPVARLQPIGAESGAAEDHADDVAAEAAVALHGGDKAAKPSLLQRLGGWFSSTVRLQRCSGGVDPTYQATKAVGPDVGRVVGVSNPSGGVWFNQRTLTAGATVGAAPDEAQAVALAKTLHRDIAVIPADGQYFLYAIVGAGDLDLDLVYGRNAGIRMEAGVAALVHHRGLTYYARDLAATTEPARPQQTGSLAALDAYQALNQERGGIDALSEPELIATFEAAMFDTALAVLSASEGQAQLKATQFKQPGATSADEHATIETTGQELVTVQTELERVTADVEMMRHPPIDDVIHTAPPGWADGLPEAEAAMARLRAEKRRLLQRYPMLGRYRSASALRSFLAGGPKEREAALAGDADAVLRDISTTRHHVLAGDLNLWGMQPVVEATVAGLGIGADSPQRARIASKAKAQRKQEAFYNVALGVFSLGFGLAAAFTSGGLSLALTAGAAGLGAYDAITTTEDFFAQNAATNTDVDPDAALLPAEARMHWGWLVVAWAGVALDFADVLKAATIAGEVEHVARGAKSIEEAAEALAKGDRKLLDRLRRAAGDTALTDTISEAIRPGLANRIGAEIIVDANLGQDVRVLYELKAAGATRVAHVKVGPGAKVADVLAHTDTIRMLNRYEGAAGKARQQWDRLRSFAGMGKAGQVPFEAGSKAFDSWHELEKLQQLIGYRRGLLAEMLEKAPSATEAQVALRTELDFLENEVDIHRRVVDAVVLERGTGAIAMSSSTRDALAAGHQLPEFPGKAAADLTADDLKSSAHYFRREADGTFTLQQKATKAPKAAPRALDAVELGPPHASWDPALGEALEIQLRRVTANNKQHRVATSIQQLARSPHGAELARRLLDPRIKAAQGYDGIVQRLLSIDEPKQADLIAELVDAEHLIETGDMTKQTLSLGETSSGTRRGDPGHYDIDSALVNADGTIETAVQTYRPRTSSLQAILRGIVEKANKQLASFPAKKKILAVHVDNLAFVSLGSEGTTLQRFARESGAEVHIVPESGGRIVFYPSGTVK